MRPAVAALISMLLLGCASPTPAPVQSHVHIADCPACIEIVKHVHVGDCPSCAGFVIVQDKVSDDLQTKAIYGEVGKAFQAATKPPAATPAAVTSKTGGAE